MTGHKAMGGHQSAAAITTTWLTPPPIIESLGGWRSFRTDPCGFDNGEHFRTAHTAICEPDDGLAAEWDGRSFVNPPYGAEAGAWLQKLANHDQGTALIFARTETEVFQRDVFERAAGLLFLAGRLHFYYPFGADPGRCFSGAPCEWVDRPGVHGTKKPPQWCPHCGQAGANSGAPSVLCAYGQDDLDRLAACDLPGTLTPLRFAKFALIQGLDLSWSAIMREWVARQGGTVSLSDAYRFFAKHPKARRNPNWRAKVRQTIARTGLKRVGPAEYAAVA